MNAQPVQKESLPAEKRGISARHFRNLIAAHVLVLSVASILLVTQSASVAQFFGSSAREAILHVGLGSVLIAIWAYTISGTLYGVATSLLSKSWLLVIPWALLVLCYLQYCPVGYAEDVSEFVQYLQSQR